jgi:hypothetical protein
MPVPKHPSFNSSRLVRSLAALGIADVADSSQTFAERLSGWIGWTDAPVLSEALAAAPAHPTGTVTVESRRTIAAEVQRVRRELVQAIESEAALAALPAARGRLAGDARSATGATDGSAGGNVDPAHGRRRQAVLQQLMEERLRPLREQVRRALRAAGPPLEKLAVLDAAFEQALAARERTLLGGAAVLVQARFERGQEPVPRDGTAPSPLSDTAWRTAMRELLLAELDTRLQPIDGMVEALQQHTAGCQA